MEDNFFVLIFEIKNPVEKMTFFRSDRQTWVNSAKNWGFITGTVLSKFLFWIQSLLYIVVTSITVRSQIFQIFEHVFVG